MRFPSEVHKPLKEAAKDEHMSINTFLVRLVVGEMKRRSQFPLFETKSAPATEARNPRTNSQKKKS